MSNTKIESLVSSFEILSHQHIQLLEILKGHSERIEFLESTISQMLILEKIGPDKYKNS